MDLSHTFCRSSMGDIIGITTAHFWMTMSSTLWEHQHHQEFSPPELRVLIWTFSNPTTPNRKYIYSTAIKTVPMCHMIELMCKESITTPQHHQCGCTGDVWGMQWFKHWTVERQHVFVLMRWNLNSSPQMKDKNVYCKSENATFINQWKLD